MSTLHAYPLKRKDRCIMKHIVKITDRNRTRTSFVTLYGLVIIGIIIGSMYAVKGEHSDSVWANQYFMPLYSGDTLFAVLRNTFISAALAIFIAFWGGLSAVGQPLGAVLLIFRGFGIGVSAAMLYSLCGIKAVPSVIVLILPKAVSVIVVTVLAVRELFRSSGALFAFVIKGEQHEDSRRTFRLYCIKFSVLLLISFFIAAADAALNYFFREALINI